MSLKVGIVGIPNAGKSTLFNALLKKQQALAANYPFATIEPNIGIVPVPDPRLEKLAQIVEKEEGKYPPLVPATIEFVDIAGLVKGASQGEGLGNKFLSHIREVSVICNVVRFFEDPDVSHVAGSIDPKRDKEIVETELIMADLSTLEKQSEPRGMKDKNTQRRWQLIGILKKELGSGKQAREVVTDEEDKQLVRDLQLMTMKPVLYVCNISEEALTANPPASPDGKVSGGRGSKQSIVNSFEPSILVSAKVESELSELTEEEQLAYLKSLGLTQSGLDRVAKKAYEMLGLISFLTMGIKEVRAWTITKGMKAPQAAGTIHTDFEKNFIKADVIAYEDLIAVGSRAQAKEQGKLRMEGRTYEMHDGDVVEFKIGK